MRYRVIPEHDRRYPIRLMCRALAVSPAGYYAWRTRPASARSAANQALLTELRHLHQESRQTYGSPRIWQALVHLGRQVGRHRVARLMRYDGLRAKTVTKWRATTQSVHQFPVASNQLNRQFAVAAPNQVWAGDITYVWTAEGWLYLAVLLDLYSRAVIGWAMGSRLTGELTQQALEMALHRRQPKPGLLHHSDRGSQYAATAYQQQLRAAGLTGSMSRRGNCWDNACVESFFGTLKRELIHHRQYRTRAPTRCRRSLNTSKCFTIGSGATPRSAISPPPSSKPRRLSHNQVSTESGEGHILARGLNAMDCLSLRFVLSLDD